MALIPKANITTGNTIQASDITNIVEALDGTPGSYTVITTGSFTGSFTGALAGSSSYALTASYALNGGSSFPFTGSAIISSSLEVTGSMKISGSLVFTGPDAYAQVSNPLVFLDTTIGKSNITAIEGFYKLDGKAIVGATDKLGTLDLSLVGSANTSGFSKGLVIPVSQSLNPVIGSMYLDNPAGLLYVYTSTGWLKAALS